METVKTLSAEDVFFYDNNGYIVIENVFSEDEVKAMLLDIENGKRVAENKIGSADKSGKKAGIALWSELGNDIWGAASTHPSIVNNVRILMREEVAFMNCKVMLKEAHSGGAWEWHQDYGYWYNRGFMFPRMMSAWVALDPSNKANGCMQVLRGSHKLGRLEHGKVGDQTGADMERITECEKLFEHIYCEMSPGSVLFFDCNTLHTSAANNSDYPRRSFISCYNALNNPQTAGRKDFEQRPCPVANEGAILSFV